MCGIQGIHLAYTQALKGSKVVDITSYIKLDNTCHSIGIQYMFATEAKLLFSLLISKILFSGPTRFSPLIEQAVRQASTLRGQKYMCLLILTDGVIMDMRPTIDSIVKASELPISILIVGVGQADFSHMETLDADNECCKGRQQTRLRSSTGQLAQRDIVQFVEFQRFRDALSLPPGSSVGHELAKALLAELPTQLVEYMTSHKILPNTPVSERGLPSNDASTVSVAV